MSRVVEHLAELTGFRDRDVLDTTLAAALRDILRPRCVGIHRCVGEEGARHWMTRARLEASDSAATADPLWAELDTLPRLIDRPARLAAVEQQAVVVVSGLAEQTVFPLATDREVVGVVEIDTDQPLTPEQLRLVGSVLRIYRNFQGLLDYSERDTLTGLLNRKTFDEAFFKIVGVTLLNPAVAARERRNAPQAQEHYIGVIDIDHFKLVNDNYGHLIGDEVLLLLSRLMRSSFRFHDKLFRFGGEEFVVLMRCGNAVDAASAFERLRRNVEAYAFPQVGHIAVSVGFTSVRLDDTPTGAFERADKAVYWVKANGRNQVCSHETLAERGESGGDTKVGDIELF